MNDFPTAPEDFDIAWVERVFAQPAGSLAALEYRPVGTGQVCDSFRFICDWRAGDAPASFIAKCPSADATSRAGAAMFHLYDMEIGWYRDCAPTAGVACPRPYYAAIADDEQHFALLIEDLAPLRQGDQIAGGSATQVAAALDAVAALHAWRPAGGDWAGLRWAHHSAGSMVIRNAMPAAYPQFRERFARLLDTEVLDLGQALVDRIDAYLDHEAPSECLRHGDLRLDNILFDRSGRTARLLDWQTVAMGRAANDVAYLIGTSFADPAERRARERGLVEAYLARRAALGGAPDSEAFWRDYRRNAFAGMIMAINAANYVERTERGDRMFAAMAERPARMALDLDSLALL